VPIFDKYLLKFLFNVENSSMMNNNTKNIDILATGLKSNNHFDSPIKLFLFYLFFIYLYYFIFILFYFYFIKLNFQICIYLNF